MKRIICAIILIILSALLVSCSGTGVAYMNTGKVETADGEIAWALSSSGKLTLSGSGTVEELPVKKDAVKQVVISSGITRIGSAAFADMKNLNSVEFPDTVKEICEDAFAGCTEMPSIDIPSAVEYISSTAFRGWNEMQKITSDWYEGSVKYWQEWYEYEREFGEYADMLKRGEELSDEALCRLSAFWNEWKQSEYWEMAKGAAEEGIKHLDGSYGYWRDFGNYLISENYSGDNPSEDWWSQAKTLSEYFEQRGKGIEAEIPAEIKDIVNEHKDDIESWVKYIREQAAEIDSSAIKEYADKAKEILNSFFGN